MKKLPSSLSTEELLKALEESSKEEKEQFLPEDGVYDVLGFVSAFNIVAGENRVKVTQIYNLYRQWSSNPIGAIHFGREVSSFFSVDTNNNYLINKSAMKLSAESFALFKKPKVSSIKSHKLRTTFANFCAEHKIKPGKVWVRLSVISQIQKEAKIKKGKKNKTPQRTIANYIKSLHEIRKIKNQKTGTIHIWVGVDPEIYSLYPEPELERLLKAYDENNKKQNKKCPSPKEEGRKDDQKGKSNLPSTGSDPKSED